MASEKRESIEQDSFLAMIEAKMAALQALKASYLAARAAGALGRPADATVSIAALAGQPALGGAPMELPRGALLGKSIPAAIRLYLSAVKQKQSIRQIATALREGGVESTAVSFETRVTGALNRQKASGDVLRFKDGWALGDLYREHLRNRITKETKPKGRKRGSGAKKQTAKKPKATNAAAKLEEPGGRLTERIEAFLRSQAKPVSPNLVAAAVDARPNVVRLTLGRMRSKRKVEKRPDGQYVASPPDLKAV